MIITEPNDFAAEVHDRMPMFLTGEQFAPWLSGQAGVEYLKPAPNDYLQRWPVSKRVISSKADADDPTLIEPIQLERLPKSPPIDAAIKKALSRGASEGDQYSDSNLRFAPCESPSQ